MKSLVSMALALLLAIMGCANTPPEPRDGQGDFIRFVGENGIATANGLFHDWRIVDSRMDRANLGESFVEVEIDVASLDTGIEGRDDHLRDPDFFEVERWPTATIRVSEVRPGDAESHYLARFDVTIRDHQETLEAPFDLVQDKPPVVEGEIVIDRVAFGVGTANRWHSPFTPNDRVPVRFRVTLE